MPRDPQVLVFIGVKNVVVALDDRSGQEIWRTPLYGGQFVSVFWDGESLLAANGGEIYRLDPRSGAVVWHNELKGLGRGLISVATSRAPTTGQSRVVENAAEKYGRDAAAAAAAAS